MHDTELEAKYPEILRVTGQVATALVEVVEGIFAQEPKEQDNGKKHDNG